MREMIQSLITHDNLGEVQGPGCLHIVGSVIKVKPRRGVDIFSSILQGLREHDGVHFMGADIAERTLRCVFDNCACFIRVQFVGRLCLIHVSEEPQLTL